ncbi:MAG: T9SS type A sorting domain-containing protein [Bacteroidales bacterium]
MKKLINLITVLVLFYPTIFAQEQKWDAYIGINGRYEQAEDVLEYYDKGYIVDGGFQSSGNWYGWQIKTNINGEILWDKTLQHNSYQMGCRASVVDSDGNIYVFGTKMVGKSWPFVAKFDPCGENLWCKILADDQLNSGSPRDIIINESGELILLCGYLTNDLKAQVYLVCLDTEGEYLWKQQYAAKEDHPWIAQPSARHLLELNNEYFISGSCYWPYPTDTNHVFLRPLFIGIDSLFNEKWILPFAPLDSVFGNAYSSIPVNDTIILGVGKRRFDSQKVFSLIMGYHINGQELWYNQITNDQISPDNKRNFIRNIEKTNDSLYIAAVFFGPLSSDNPIGEFIIDTAGNLFNFQSRPNCFTSPSIIKAFDGNFVVASSIKKPNNDQDIYLYKIDENLESVPFDNTPYVYDSLCPTPIQSGIIDLTSCMVWTGTEEVPSPQQYYATIAQIPLTAYPNPAETGITLAFQNTEHHNNMLLECYNLFGQRVHSEKVYKGQQKTKLSIEQWQSGLYIAVIKSNGRVAGQVWFVRR